jgi:CMP-N,N'-diacetyllegionaminic acid synthase
MNGPVIVIPARGGSKGIPRKNIMDFCGKPLIAWSIEQGLVTGLPVYVSTEDIEISLVAKEFGAEVIPRPAELATDEAGMNDVLKHAREYLDVTGPIVLLQPTSPLRLPGDIENAIEKFNESGDKYLVCCYEKTCIEATTRNKVNQRRQDLVPRLFEHGMVYIYGTCGDKFSHLHRTPEWKSHEIDEPEDVEICEFYMRNKVLC